jgi:hypothetical protein
MSAACALSKENAHIREHTTYTYTESIVPPPIAFIEDLSAARQCVFVCMSRETRFEADHFSSRRMELNIVSYRSFHSMPSRTYVRALEIIHHNVSVCIGRDLF